MPAALTKRRTARRRGSARTIGGLVVLPAILLVGCAGAAGVSSEPPDPAEPERTPAGKSLDTTPVAPVTSVVETPDVGAPGDRTVDDRAAFQSPTGNIGCQISTSGVRCDIGERGWEPPPRPADCRLDYGHALGLSATAPARLMCAGDSARGSGEVLAYGDAITAGPIRCESAPAGITCRSNESEHGFMLSRESYTLF